MKNEKKEFCHQSLQDRETIIELLSSIQKGLTKGTLSFSDEDNDINLKPPGLLSLTINASSSNELNVLDLRITWQDRSKDKLKKEIKISID
jgi:amphi-Trp domain-containing protein